MQPNAHIANPSSAHSNTMNVNRPVGADLSMTKNFDTAQLRDVVNLVGQNDANKVFYNTRGLQLKNSLSNSIRAKSHGH